MHFDSGGGVSTCSILRLGDAHKSLGDGKNTHDYAPIPAMEEESRWKKADYLPTFPSMMYRQSCSSPYGGVFSPGGLEAVLEVLKYVPCLLATVLASCTSALLMPRRFLLGISWGLSSMGDHSVTGGEVPFCILHLHTCWREEWAPAPAILSGVSLLPGPYSSWCLPGEYSMIPGYESRLLH